MENKFHTFNLCSHFPHLSAKYSAFVFHEWYIPKIWWAVETDYASRIWSGQDTATAAFSASAEEQNNQPMPPLMEVEKLSASFAIWNFMNHTNCPLKKWFPALAPTLTHLKWFYKYLPMGTLPQINYIWILGVSPRPPYFKIAPSWFKCAIKIEKVISYYI